MDNESLEPSARQRECDGGGGDDDVPQKIDPRTINGLASSI
jgi:hypothetical protein